jgi:hypothetical protein
MWGGGGWVGGAVAGARVGSREARSRTDRVVPHVAIGLRVYLPGQPGRGGHGVYVYTRGPQCARQEDPGVTPFTTPGTPRLPPAHRAPRLRPPAPPCLTAQSPRAPPPASLRVHHSPSCPPLGPSSSSTQDCPTRRATGADLTRWGTPPKKPLPAHLVIHPV